MNPSVGVGERWAVVILCVSAGRTGKWARQWRRRESEEGSSRRSKAWPVKGPSTASPSTRSRATWASPCTAWTSMNSSGACSRARSTSPRELTLVVVKAPRTRTFTARGASPCRVSWARRRSTRCGGTSNKGRRRPRRASGTTDGSPLWGRWPLRPSCRRLG